MIEDEKILVSDKTKEDTRKCPNCGGTLTEANFYKLKSGNDTKCEYCNVIISSH